MTYFPAEHQNLKSRFSRRLFLSLICSHAAATRFTGRGDHHDRDPPLQPLHSARDQHRGWERNAADKHRDPGSLPGRGHRQGRETPRWGPDPSGSNLSPVHWRPFVLICKFKTLKVVGLQNPNYVKASFAVFLCRAGQDFSVISLYFPIHVERILFFSRA